MRSAIFAVIIMTTPFAATAFAPATTLQEPVQAWAKVTVVGEIFGNRDNRPNPEVIASFDGFVSGQIGWLGPPPKKAGKVYPDGKIDYTGSSAFDRSTCGKAN